MRIRRGILYQGHGGSERKIRTKLTRERTQLQSGKKTRRGEKVEVTRQLRDNPRF